MRPERPVLPLSISEVDIIPVKPRNGLIAFASCVVNDQLYLGNIAIHTRLDGSGYRLVFPVKVLPNGKEIQCVHPVTRRAGELLLQAIVEKLAALIAGAQRDENVAAMTQQPGGIHGNGPTSTP